MRTPGTFITSPNHPSNYGHGLHCNLIIRFQPGQKILITFVQFDLHDSRCNDWLEIKDGDKEDSKIIGKRLCAGKYPATVTSTTNAIKLSFNSDSDWSKAGFKIKVDLGMLQD